MGNINIVTYDKTTGERKALDTNWIGRVMAQNGGTPVGQVTPNNDSDTLILRATGGLTYSVDDPNDVLIIDGSALAGNGVYNSTEFLTSGSWVVPTGIEDIRVTATAGGGGGGSNEGYGGAGGHYVSGKMLSVTAGNTLIIGIGNSGAGGTNSNGSSGGSTTIQISGGAFILNLSGGEGGPGGNTGVDTHVARGGTNGGCAASAERLNTGQGLGEYKGGDGDDEAGGGGAGINGAGGDGATGSDGQSAPANSGAGGGGTELPADTGGSGGTGYVLIEWWV